MTFTFPDGSIGVVDYLANGDKSVQKERLEVFCEGMIAVLDDYVSLTVTRDGKKTSTRMAQDKGWQAEMSAFARSVREGGEAPIPLEQLLGVTRATFAAVESLHGGDAVEIR
jgi:predicted dehydrogenase